MHSIGLIGVGFVGYALLSHFKKFFDIVSFDKSNGRFSTKSNCCEANNHYEWVVKNVEGPIFICVPTPSRSDGSCDTSIVEFVVDCLALAARFLERKITVVIKSTVPPGTCDALQTKYNDVADICFNPEFLVERTAIEDFANPSRVVLGGVESVVNEVENIYKITFPTTPIIKTSAKAAELAKYITNVFLATKVALANEFYQIAVAAGLDYDEVIRVAKSDDRLGKTHWAVPGPDGKFGYGGSCFPKDLAALIAFAIENTVIPTVMRAALIKNREVRT